MARKKTYTIDTFMITRTYLHTCTFCAFALHVHIYTSHLHIHINMYTFTRTILHNNTYNNNHMHVHMYIYRCSHTATWTYIVISPILTNLLTCLLIYLILGNLIPTYSLNTYLILSCLILTLVTENRVHNAHCPLPPLAGPHFTHLQESLLHTITLHAT